MSFDKSATVELTGRFPGLLQEFSLQMTASPGGLDVTVKILFAREGEADVSKVRTVFAPLEASLAAPDAKRILSAQGLESDDLRAFLDSYRYGGSLANRTLTLRVPGPAPKQAALLFSLPELWNLGLARLQQVRDSQNQATALVERLALHATGGVGQGRFVRSSRPVPPSWAPSSGTITRKDWSHPSYRALGFGWRVPCKSPSAFKLRPTAGRSLSEPMETSLATARGRCSRKSSRRVRRAYFALIHSSF